MYLNCRLDLRDHMVVHMFGSYFLCQRGGVR
jgi:hypothetical protein